MTRRKLTINPPHRPPHIIFFCELAPRQLHDLFARDDVVALLAQQDYHVSLALPDLSSERSAVVRLLNAHNIPVIAWLLVPREHGYWFNLQNYPHALQAYADVRRWIATEGLTFAGVGLDIEPALADIPTDTGAHAAQMLARRLFRSPQNALFPAAQQAYQDLVASIRHDGYIVYGYQLPLIVDDRRAGTTLVQRMFDLVDLPVDEEVLMCYSSRLPHDLCSGDLNGALVQSYGLHADGIAIGSTGGGAVRNPLTGNHAERLSWTAFERDLRIAAEYAETVHIFSLEGCVEQDWLDRISTIDWTMPVEVPRRDRVAISAARSILAVWLFGSRFGLSMLGWLGWLVAGWLVLRRRPVHWPFRHRNESGA